MPTLESNSAYFLHNAEFLGDLVFHQLHFALGSIPQLFDDLELQENSPRELLPTSFTHIVLVHGFRTQTQDKSSTPSNQKKKQLQQTTLLRSSLAANSRT